MAIPTTDWGESLAQGTDSVRDYREISADLVFRYLARYPSGAHAEEARQQADRRLVALDHLLHRPWEKDAARARFFCQDDIHAQLALASLIQAETVVRLRFPRRHHRDTAPQIDGGTHHSVNRLTPRVASLRLTGLIWNSGPGCAE